MFSEQFYLELNFSCLLANQLLDPLELKKFDNNNFLYDLKRT